MPKTIKMQLENGLTVVAERIAHSRSVSVGLFVRAGSVFEGPKENGISHFIEHMLFKGTKSMSAREIALRMDAIGAQLNAYTSKEYTCFYAKTMDAHISISLPLLADMLRHSLFDAAEIKKESGVILEEIAMVEDMPDDIVYDVLAKAQFGEHPLGQTILGPEENVAGFAREDFMAYMEAMYYPANCVLAVAGNFEEEGLFALCQELFGDWSGNAEKREQTPFTLYGDDVLTREKDVEQVHICLSCPGVALGDDAIYALNIFNNIFGGSMSSRLFQRIREELGMAYSVYSFPTTYAACGAFSIYAGTSEKTAVPVLQELRSESRKILEEGFTEEEFHWGKEQLRGSYILSQESASARMMAIGRSQLLHGRTRPEAEIIKKIEAVTMEDVQASMEKAFHGVRSAAAVGRITADIQAELEML